MSLFALPKRRLSNESIKNLVEKFVVNDLVLGKSDVFSARLTWRTSSKEDGVRAKNLISNKRNSCDSIVSSIKGVLFFYSCVTVIENRKRKTPGSDDESRDDKTAFPCINYWIVMEKFSKEVRFNIKVYISK